jgi:hypothetical protein
MRRFFRWFALSALVGAMASGFWGGSGAAQANTVCGHAQVDWIWVSIVNDCRRPCPSGMMGAGPTVTAGGHLVDTLICVKMAAAAN